MNELIYGKVLKQEHHDYLMWLRDSGEVTTDGEIAISNLILTHFGVEE